MIRYFFIGAFPAPVVLFVQAQRLHAFPSELAAHVDACVILITPGFIVSAAIVSTYSSLGESFSLLTALGMPLLFIVSMGIHYDLINLGQVLKASIIAIPILWIFVDLWLTRRVPRDTSGWGWTSSALVLLVPGVALCLAIIAFYYMNMIEATKPYALLASAITSLATYPLCCYAIAAPLHRLVRIYYEPK
jgi:signal transduction histidine kinase